MSIYRLRKYVLHFHNSPNAGKHYDLRIQYLHNNYSLISFALPKNYIPVKPGEKILAIQTPDHHAAWLTKERFTIDNTNESTKKTIMIVQSGFFEIYEWNSDSIVFNCPAGDYMNGFYQLKKTRDKVKNPKWELIKLQD